MIDYGIFSPVADSLLEYFKLTFEVSWSPHGALCYGFRVDSEPAIFERVPLPRSFAHPDAEKKAADANSKASLRRAER